MDTKAFLGIASRSLLLAIAVVFLAFAGPASAATIVPDLTFDDNTAGSFCSLREAVQSANTDADVGGCTHSGAYGADTILLGGGEYQLTLKGSPEDSNASGDLDVTHSLTIQGLGADVTGIDGNGTITGDRVLDVFNSGTTMSLSDVAIHGGRDSTGGGGGIRAANGTTLNVTGSTVSGNNAITGASAYGGGIRADTVNVTNSTVSANSSAFLGGGILAGTANVTNSTVSGNSSVDYGGGIFADTANLTGSTVKNNSSSDSTSGFGGGIASDITVNATNSTVSDNRAAAGGGGIAALTVHLTGITVSGNSAGLGGGGMGVASGTLTATTVRRNVSALRGGGIEYDNDGDLSISRSTIAGNDTIGPGGGVYFPSGGPGGTLTVTNSTLAGNEATASGGGLSSAAGTTNLQNATINRNTADSDSDGIGDGGGIDQAPGATVNVKNTIVAQNLDTGGERPDCNANAGVTSQGYNLFGSCAITLATGDIPGANPLVAQLGQNGGPTLTSALLPGSPAINAVPVSGAGCPPTDQRGVARPQGAGCDIGAYEVAPPRVITGAASAVTAKTARLAGSVNPELRPTSYRFDYGKTTAYGSHTALHFAGAGATAVAVAAKLTGLAPNTTFHYRLIASNADGTGAGADRTFRTPKQCIVPNLKGKKLGKAKAALLAANCKLGKVTNKKATGKPGRVLSQSPTSGTRLPAGSKVAVVVSKR